MNTEELEQQAMNKIYNSQIPDQLEDKSPILENNQEDNLSIVPDILKRHEQAFPVSKSTCGNDFSYIAIKDTSWKWHFIKFFNNKYGMLLSDNYILEYSSAIHNSEQFGKLIFRKEREYTLEYRKATLEEFYNQMTDLSEVFSLIEKFETERNQQFYEYDKDSIYLYQDNYIFKLSGYSRNDITEYYQMYVFLMSLTLLEQGYYQDNHLLKFFYLIENNAISYLYREVDLKKKKISELLEEFSNHLDVVTVSLDNNRYHELIDLDYSIYSRKRMYEKREETPISILYQEKCFFNGDFPIGIFGIYSSGELLDFSSIFSSTEFSEPEKKELLKKIVEVRKQECLEKKDYLDSQFLFSFFEKRITHGEDLFDKEGWIEFLKLENMALDDLSLQGVKTLILEKMNLLNGLTRDNLEDNKEWQVFLSYIDIPAFQSKIKSLYLTITPLFMVLECMVLNDKKNYIITEDYQMMEWV